MKISEAGLALIRKFESFKNAPYVCPAGLPTIGYGHVILPHESFATITRAQGEDLLRQDVAPAERILSYHTLTQPRFDALCSFIYNVGVGAYKASTLRKLVVAGDYTRAADQFRFWVFGGGRKLPGLVARRNAEARMFLSEDNIPPS